MAVKIHGSLQDKKKVFVQHEPSKAFFNTSAPIDNNGDGSSFSPTDLLATGLGSCMLTIISIVAEKNNILLNFADFSVEKIMTSELPRKIASLPIVINLPENLSLNDRITLEKAAKNCPVLLSLNPDIEVNVIFKYC